MILSMTGSRKVKHIPQHILDKHIKDLNPTLVIHGGAQGADTIVEKYCKQNNIPTKIIRPQYWQCHGNQECIKKKPLERNKTIVDEGDMLVAFPYDNGYSGTSYTIKYAKDTGKPVTLINMLEVERIENESTKY